MPQFGNKSSTLITHSEYYQHHCEPGIVHTYRSVRSHIHVVDNTDFYSPQNPKNVHSPTTAMHLNHSRVNNIRFSICKGVSVHNLNMENNLNHVNLGYTSYMPTREDLLRTARELLHDDVLYDPENWHMNIQPHEVFRFNVSLGLWQIALQQDVYHQTRYFDFY